MWLHWRDWTKRWLHARQVESNLTWTHSLRSKLLVETKHALVLFVRQHCCLEFALVHIVQISLLQIWIGDGAIRLFVELAFDTLSSGVFHFLDCNFFTHFFSKFLFYVSCLFHVSSHHC